MRHQLDTLGVEYEFIKGVDYRDMSEEDFRRQCDPRALSGDNYLKGVFAASLSHLKAYQQIVDENLDYALVCEDDAVFPSSIRLLMDQVAQEMRPDEIVMLSYYSHLHQPLALSNHHAHAIAGGMQLLSPVHIAHVASAMAYIVPKQVAARLIEVLMPVNHVPDYWGEFYTKGGFAGLRCLYPHIMSDAPFTSIVEYPASKTWIFKVKSVLRKIPLVTLLINRVMQQKTMEKYQFLIVDEKPFSEHAA